MTNLGKTQKNIKKFLGSFENPAPGDLVVLAFTHNCYDKIQSLDTRKLLIQRQRSLQYRNAVHVNFSYTVDFSYQTHNLIIEALRA